MIIIFLKKKSSYAWLRMMLFEKKIYYAL